LKNNTFTVPKEVSQVTETLQSKGFQAYLVGGCVRDLLRGEKPKDWDITTNAKPEEIQECFEHSFYENDYGTVGVVDPVRADGASPTSNGTGEGAVDPTLRVIEVTPYRVEGKYEDGRRPSEIHFSDNLEEDLQRRDFTINAIAYDPSKGQLVDLYNGQKDIKDKVIRTVGKPADRFGEDYLRMLRAVRLATELDFSINKATEDAIRLHVKHLDSVSRERVRDEFSKMLMATKPLRGIELAHELGVLAYVTPELEEGIDVEQNGDHIYAVWEHNLRALQHSADREWPLHIRLSALLHDVAKPATRRWSKEKNDWTFYGHDVVGGRMAKKILTRLKYSNEEIDTVSKLVRHHLFFTDIDKITLSAVRRIVSAVGPERVWDLMKVRACDRIGMGRPKEKPYRLRKYESMIEEAMRAPVSVGMLKIDGGEIMELTGEKPGPRLGFILHALLEEVLEDPELNTKKYMEKRVKELVKLSDKDLQKLGEAGKEKKDAEEEKELQQIRKRHGVK